MKKFSTTFIGFTFVLLAFTGCGTMMNGGNVRHKAVLASVQSAVATATNASVLPVVSPEIHSNGTVTFRLRAPGATTVSVSIESVSGAMPMTRDSQGIWNTTLGPLPADVYAYGFSVDGFRTLDPANPSVQPRRSLTASLFEVPANKPQYYDFQPVPHGVVRIEQYQSKSLGRRRTLLVYTPPGYDQDSHVRYPVLYLLHGYGDNEATWTGAGRAPWIADNLLAQGKARPMIIVMTDGHAVVPPESGRDPKATLRNLLAFEGDLLQDVIPFIETNYRVASGPEYRAIIGPSMGGRQSMTIGLQNPALFAWVGGMSASLPTPESTLTNLFKNPGISNDRLKLLWFCCGTSDPLLPEVRHLDELLNEHGIRHQFHEFAGGHGWPTWRPALADFLELIFNQTPNSQKARRHATGVAVTSGDDKNF